MGQYNNATYFVLLVAESPKVIVCFSPKLLPAAIHSCEVLHAHGIVYFYNTVGYAVGFLAFTGTNKGLNIIYIQDTVEGVENLTHWHSTFYNTWRTYKY
jgi:hypothetical protein